MKEFIFDLQRFGTQTLTPTLKLNLPWNYGLPFEEFLTELN